MKADVTVGIPALAVADRDSVEGGRDVVDGDLDVVDARAHRMNFRLLRAPCEGSICASNELKYH